MDDIGKELMDLMEAAADDLRGFGWDEIDELRRYAGERAKHLSTLVRDPGFREAFVAERDAMALRLGIAAADAGDAVDAKLLGVLEGALGIAAKALAIGLV